MIILRNITKKVKNISIIDNVSCTFDRGDVICITGPSGSGKTSLARIIAGMDSFTSGEVVLNSDIFSANNYRKLRGKIGFVFQGCDLFYNLDVFDNIIYAPIKVMKKSPEMVHQKGRQLLDLFGIKECSNLKHKDLSGGQRQRVCIVRTLMTDPEIMIFDEPTSALDRDSVNSFLHIIRKVINKNIIVIIITHDQYIVNQLATKVINIRNGTIVS